MKASTIIRDSFSFIVCSTEFVEDDLKFLAIR